MIFGFFIGGVFFYKKSFKRALLRYRFGSVDVYLYIVIEIRNTPN